MQRTGKYRQPLTAPPRNTEEIAELYDHILVGDDFLMAVATAELGVNFTKCMGKSYQSLGIMAWSDNFV